MSTLKANNLDTESGTTITVAAGKTLAGTDIIGATQIADDAVTPAKINIFDDALAATTTHFLIADGTDYSSFALSGDITSTNAGAVTIANNAINNAKMADDAIGVAELSATGTASSSTFLRGDNAWAAPSSDMVLLQTLNADSGSEAKFESKFDSTYNWYVIYWQLVPGTNAAETSVQFMSGSSVVAPGNAYEYSWNGTVFHTGAAVVGYGTGQNDVRFGNSTSNATFGQSGQAIIFDPNNNFGAGEYLNGRFQVTWRHGGNYYISAQGGFVFGVDQGNADGFYFAPTSGTWTYFDAQLYGVK